MADRLELTHVKLSVQGEAYYPEIPQVLKDSKYATKDDKSGIEFEFATYQK